PGVATGFQGAAALRAMPSSYNSAAKLFVNRFSAEVFYLDDKDSSAPVVDTDIGPRLQVAVVAVRAGRHPLRQRQPVDLWSRGRRGDHGCDRLPDVDP